MKTLHTPAHIAAYVDVLGAEGTVEFLLTFGGAELYLAEAPTERSQVVKSIGMELAIALAKEASNRDLPRRVPTAKPWLAAMLWRKGLPVAQIARKLHVSDVTVRAYLKRLKPVDDRQLPLI
jgi:hypothetical protein